MDEESDDTGSRQRRRTRVGILLAAVVMVIAATVGVLVSRPRELHVFGGTLGEASTTRPVGQPVYVSLSVTPEDDREDDGVPENDPPLLATMFVRTASAVIARNDAKATVEVGTYRFGVSGDSLDDELVLAVTPHRHGTVRTVGVHLVYDQDGDHGDEHVGLEVTIHAK